MSLSIRRGVLLLLGVSLLAACFRSQPVTGTVSNPYRYPYNQPTSINFNTADVTQAWNSWKASQITATNAGGGGRLRVMGGTDTSSTVSEGMGYGILFASLFDDQATLDGLWLFTRDYLNAHGLMHWHIGNPGQTLGTGAATDGDADMALGLLNACIKVQQGAWSASPNGLDYCQLASNLINAIYTYEVDHPGAQPLAGLTNNPGDELLPGDMWSLSSDYQQGIVNLSYFAPGYFTVFGKFTNNLAAWQAVNARNYAITNLVQAKPGNCSKLVPNWNQYDGDPQQVSWQPEEYAWWSYDAARFAWRIAVDRAWYDSASARETLNEVGGFFSSVGINNLKARYRLDGASVDSYTNAFFLGNAAAAIWGAPNPQPVSCGAATPTLKTTPQQAYDKLLQTQDSSYYPGAWRLFSMLLLTGNFPNFYEIAHSSPQPSATPTTSAPTATPTRTPAAPTSTPAAPTATPQPGGCSVKYSVANDWGSGFTSDVIITNNGPARSSWSLSWAFAGNQQITNLWNGGVSQSGQNVTVTNATWNGSLPTGGSASFGFQASYSGSNAKPTSFKLNGSACTITP